MRSLIPHPLLLPLAALLLAGCAGYRLGSQLPPDINTVYLHIARNHTEEPQIEDAVTRAVLSQLQRDGSLQVTSEDAADSIMHVDITRFELTPLAYGRDNRARPDEYRLILHGNTTLLRADTETALVRSTTLQGRSTFLLQGDLTSSKQNALPDAADDLARRIVAAVTEAWPEP